LPTPETGGSVRAVSAKRILLCDDDELELAALRSSSESAGLEVVDTARNAVELIRLVDVLEADAAVIRNEVTGLSGVEATRELAGRDRRVEVVLLTSDPSIERVGLDAGAFAVVQRGDLEALERALGALSEWLGGGERRRGPDRRSGEDRRQVQDWSKVFSERRSGEDRRKALRRKSDRMMNAVKPTRFVPRAI
jgi:CheY-like chemotaxis protein